MSSPRRLTIAQALEHCRADVADEPIVQLYFDAATDAAQDYIKRRIYGTQEELEGGKKEGTAGVHPMVATFAIKAAILLICGHLYANREAVVTGTIATLIPLGAHDLLRPYRLSFGV